MKIKIFLFLSCLSTLAYSQDIPLPEHPRPDFERTRWINLNGTWDFEFDSLNMGLKNKWQKGTIAFSQRIKVPFSWGSPLSGVKDEADYAWYKRKITVPSSWSGQRVFITIGASDWETTVWLDGVLLGRHQGGYTPFSFELTGIQYDRPQELVIRVDDKRRDFTLYGKQGYGNARGIWQTIYLEARGTTYLDYIHFTPDINSNTVSATLKLSDPLEAGTDISFNIRTPDSTLRYSRHLEKGADHATFNLSIPQARLWNLDDPYLYETVVKMQEDTVKTYFGMRKISVMNLPGTGIPYIALNNQPVYLQLTLDQSYHPDGYYTFPSDAFMKNEIQLCKDIGLNGIRTHVKIDIPRKLYWADKLGLLVMSDLPNSWGEPGERMQEESEYTLREMIKRDFNHPAIFSWILFNETWGLKTKVSDDKKTGAVYLPATQNWVVSMYYLAKSLDPSRLIEDNSICCGRGHTVTDINSWHQYLPGWEWEDYLNDIVKNSFPGSNYHFETGYQEGNQPNINSECGNVWGYDGSTGDVDWSWDYHRMMNSFRKYPKVAGWLYTEHHDVINEWNGYWRYDRTKKFTGLAELFPGMTEKDFHSAFYLSTGNEICKSLGENESMELPLYLSVMSGKTLPDDRLNIEYSIEFMDKTGGTTLLGSGKIPVDYHPWMQKMLQPLTIKAPGWGGLGIVKLTLTDNGGNILHHNFMHFVVASKKVKDHTTILDIQPNQLAKSEWSQKSWEVMDGLKMNGAGKGYFEYHIPITAEMQVMKARNAFLLFEASAKQLFDKDRDLAFDKHQDYMLGARVSPHKNPNAYPMTDEMTAPSTITVSVNGKKIKTVVLPDDPADHRGVLSWHSQLQDKKLREAGSYGYLIKLPITKNELKQSLQQGFISIRIATEGEGGLAIYGESFGRYPISPEIVINK
ncbi:MAG: glycoside hydrolase family 2 [Terrimonas sp.]|nr:glycoside hydrolase family 2 [Terrimonas sp.]